MFSFLSDQIVFLLMGREKKKKKVQLVNWKKLLPYVEIHKCMGLVVCLFVFFLLLPFAFANLPVKSGQTAKIGVESGKCLTKSFTY